MKSNWSKIFFVSLSALLTSWLRSNSFFLKIHLKFILIQEHPLILLNLGLQETWFHPSLQRKMKLWTFLITCFLMLNKVNKWRPQLSKLIKKGLWRLLKLEQRMKFEQVQRKRSSKLNLQQRDWWIWKTPQKELKSRLITRRTTTKSFTMLLLDKPT